MRNIFLVVVFGDHLQGKDLSTLSTNQEQSIIDNSEKDARNGTLSRDEVVIFVYKVRLTQAAARDAMTYFCIPRDFF
jgi:hypothetical protein